jgi:hypothetical protein
VKVAHPRTGVTEEIEVTSKVVAGIVFSALYSPLTASILPSLIERAEHDDFQGLLALAFAGESTTDSMSLGMQLSVLCSEDSPRYSPADIAREAAGTLFGTRLLTGQVAACQFWPKGVVDAGYYEPVESGVPALVLSGEIDPVTPPTWGIEVVKHLKNGRHLVMPGTGHGVAATACGNRIVSDFIDSADAARLDTACLHNVHRPGFFLTPAGPEPAPLNLGGGHQGRRPVIAAIDLKKYFGPVAAVNGVTFTAYDGQVTGLLGPNGAGKTTTLRMLYGVMRPDAGTSRSITWTPPSTRATRRRGSACCPTSPASTRGSRRGSRCAITASCTGSTATRSRNAPTSC